MSRLNFSTSAPTLVRRPTYPVNPRTLLAQRPSRQGWAPWMTYTAAAAVATSAFLLVWLV